MGRGIFLKTNMTKKLMLLLLVICICIGSFPARVKAAEECNIVHYEDDGSYTVESITYLSSRASGLKSGSKRKRYYDDNDVLQWTVTVTGTFSCDGSSATCTASGCSVSISNSEWYTISKTASKSGNSATGMVTMGRKILGVTTKQVASSVTLTCDDNGNVS